MKQAPATTMRQLRNRQHGSSKYRPPTLSRCSGGATEDYHTLFRNFTGLQLLELRDLFPPNHGSADPAQGPFIDELALLGVILGQPPSRPGEFHPEPLTDPDLNLSIHPARAIDEELPPFVKTAG